MAELEVRSTDNQLLGHIYSDTPRSEPEMKQALDYFIKSQGDVPQGYTYNQVGLANDARQAFESVIGGPARGLANIIEGQQAQGQGGISSVLNMARQFAAAPVRGVSTPSGFGATVGALATAPFAGGMSLPAAAMLTGVGAGAGSLAGQAGTGQDVKMSKVFTEALLAGVAKGATGLINVALGTGVTQRAKAQVAEGIVDLVKRKYASLTNDPHALEIIASSPNGATELAQLGMKAVMGDFDKTGGRLLTDLKDMLPKGSLASGASQRLNNSISTYGKAAVQLVESTGNQDATAAARSTMQSARSKIIDIVTNDLNLKGQTATQAGVQRIITQANNVLDQYENTLVEFKPALDLFKVLERAGAKGGFNPRNLQEELAEIYKSGNPLLREAGGIAARGGDLTAQGGIDRNAYVADYLINTLRLPSFIRPLLRGPRVGTLYAGKVEGTLPVANAVTSATVTSGIRSFIDEK